MADLGFGTLGNKNKEKQNSIVSGGKDTPKKTGKVSKAASEPKAKGRPVDDAKKGKKRDYCKTINIAVDKEIMDKVNEYALPGRGVSLTEYVNALIKKDLEDKMATYKAELKRKASLF